jgi:hypothetical protein
VEDVVEGRLEATGDTGGPLMRHNEDWPAPHDGDVAAHDAAEGQGDAAARNATEGRPDAAIDERSREV